MNTQYYSPLLFWGCFHFSTFCISYYVSLYSLLYLLQFLFAKLSYLAARPHLIIIIVYSQQIVRGDYQIVEIFQTLSKSKLRFPDAKGGLFMWHVIIKWQMHEKTKSSLQADAGVVPSSSLVNPLPYGVGVFKTPPSGNKDCS